MEEEQMLDLLQHQLEALERIVSHRQQMLDERDGQPLMLQVQQFIDPLREERDEQHVVILTDNKVSQAQVDRT